MKRFMTQIEPSEWVDVGDFAERLWKLGYTLVLNSDGTQRLYRRLDIEAIRRIDQTETRRRA